MLLLLSLDGPADSPSCSVEYEKVGCYQDDLGSRALPQLLVTDRDTSSPVFSEQLFNWKEPEASMTRCNNNNYDKNNNNNKN